MLVDGARPFAKQVINDHHIAAQHSLSPIITGTTNNLGKLQTEAHELQKSWKRLAESLSNSFLVSEEDDSMENEATAEFRSKYSQRRDQHKRD